MIAANGFEPELRHQHDLLIANCLAQSEALMKGRTFEEAKAQLTSKGMEDKQADFIAPHRVFTGNRPSITFVQDKLTPFAFGRLVALYEHRVFVEGVLFASTPSTSGVWNSARNWQPACFGRGRQGKCCRPRFIDARVGERRWLA